MVRKLRPSSGTGGYLGVTPPITTSGTSGMEETATEELVQELRSQGIFESEEESKRRQQVLGMVHDLVRKFVYYISLNSGISQQVAKAAGSKIFTFGSYRLGVHSPGSDIDTLCVVPKHVTHAHFFAIFEPMLKEMKGVTKVVLSGIPGAYVPIIKAEILGIPFDLLCASLNRADVLDDLELEDDGIMDGLDRSTIRSLGGTRVADGILRLVPNQDVFRDSLRCIKLWAQRRAIYSKIHGFLGGVAWAILVTRVCQLYPNLNAGGVVHRFFIITLQWKWPQPILLRPIEEEDPSKRTNLRVWNPRLYPSDRNHLMPIITPAYTSTCSTHNVTQSTLLVIKEEFKRACQIIEQIMFRRAKWSELFAKHDFFQEYRYYLQIVASSGGADDQLKWSGMVESKIRQLIVKLEFVDQLEVARPFVKGFNQVLYCLDDAEVRAVAQGDVSPVIEKRTEEDMKMTLGISKVYTTTFYIGMKPAERKVGTSGPRKLDISYATTDFTKQVKQWEQYGEETHGIVIRHIKSSTLPDHVFDGGVRPGAPKTLKRPKSGGLSLAVSAPGSLSSLQTEPKYAEPLPPVSSPDVDREIVGAFSDLAFEASKSSESQASPSKNAPSSSIGHPVSISRFMTAQEVVSRLVAHGCDDLSTAIKASTFGEYPISHGGCSDIYRGQLQDGSRVAIKLLRISLESLNENPKHLKHAARELHTWGKCKHPSIIPLLGLALFRGTIGMISPWMGQGSLPHYLKRTPGANRHSLCIQICEGLAYLHHIGIANVLVSDEGNAVLTDFGNSSLVDRTMRFTQTTSSASMTVRWSAAELIAGNPPTETSDLYALGM
ncbi:unnamed protein product, partial [Rhizoctonia solani]